MKLSPRVLVLGIILASVGLACGLAVLASEAQNGSWTIQRSDEAGKVRFALMQHHKNGTSHHESDWDKSAFQGLDFSVSGKHDVKFAIVRDAGRFDCEGFLHDGEGAGIYRFTPDAKYSDAMRAVGFPVDDEKQYAMAIQDVSVEFAKQMKAENLDDLDTDKLIAFRIFGVDTAFIDALRAQGIPAKDSDKLVAFRIHGVSPEMVRALKSSGYSPDEDTLIAMRIHGATPEWVEQLKKDGYDHVDLQKLIAFRIHGVSPEFIEKLGTLGYKHPEPDQLIAMRIHNVTPEFIQNLRSRGMKDLTIDQLVSLRIHGID